MARTFDNSRYLGDQRERLYYMVPGSAWWLRARPGNSRIIRDIARFVGKISGRFSVFFLLITLLTFTGGCQQEKKQSVLPSPTPPKLLIETTNIMVYIPAGKFIMGTDQKKRSIKSDTILMESPARRIPMNAFYIDKYEVNVRSYAKFLNETGNPKPRGWDKIDFAIWANYPVTNIAWEDAAAYAEWAGKRLPTEAEWEYAARGRSGRIYPWGDEFNEKNGNFSSRGMLTIASFDTDISPFGVRDMAGNVSEWTADLLKAYPGNTHKNENYSKNYRVYRGGSFSRSPQHGKGEIAFIARCSTRGFADPKVGNTAIGFRCARSIPAPAVPISPRSSPGREKTVKIPAGEFLIGCDPEKERVFPDAYGFKTPPYLNEAPMHRVSLPSFSIDLHEITIAQYQQFLNETGYFRVPKYWHKFDLLKMKDYPVTFVSWEDATAYAQWTGKRLPSEAEWEYAARSSDGRRYPWGNEFDDDQKKLLAKGTLPVGSNYLDKSPFGVFDMALNVSEWTADSYGPYPQSTFFSREFGDKLRVIRGGSNNDSDHYNMMLYNSRTSHRSTGLPGSAFGDVGFRCAF